MKALVYHLSPARWVLCKALGLVSKRAYLGPISPLRLVDWPVPPLPGPRWVRLRTTLGGICGTDLALVTQRNHPATVLQGFASFPAILGHENVAVIEDVGADVSSWRRGQRVCVEPAIGCIGRGIVPPCPQCAAGRWSLCEKRGDNSLPPRAMIGLNGLTGGSWAESFVAHECQLHAVPDGVPDDAAVLVDPIASAAHAVLRREPLPGERILVNGGGVVALGVVASIRALNHANPVTVLVRHPFQAELARRLGADEVVVAARNARAAARYDEIAQRTSGYRVPGRFGNHTLIGGFDLTFDCTGTGAGLTDAMKWTRSRGTVVALGTSGISVVDTTPIWFDELNVIGANGRQIEGGDGRPIHTYDLVLEWMRTGRGDSSLIPVRRYGLSEYREAFAHLLRRGRHQIVKAVFDPRR